MCLVKLSKKHDIINEMFTKFLQSLFDGVAYFFLVKFSVYFYICLYKLEATDELHIYSSNFVQ